MNVFSYLEYRPLLQALLKNRAAPGRGQKTRWAAAMGVHTTFVTHVLQGKNDLSAEQALKAAEFFSLSPLETDFMLTLIQANRAGDATSKKYFRAKVELLRKEGLALKEQLRQSTGLTLEEQAIFYSDWIYSAIRLATALPQGGSVEEIAKALLLPVSKVAKVMDFLIQVQLCKREKGRLTFSTFSTYLGSESPFVKKHHDNWRLRAMQFGQRRPEELSSTTAMTLTPEDFLFIRERIVECLKEVQARSDKSEPKILAHLNIDWLKVI